MEACWQLYSLLRSMMLYFYYINISSKSTDSRGLLKPEVLIGGHQET